ncbi:DUF3939 domain-containing protein [Paenalkalicoccus suaedae]|uniref:DUF3939 domain-containing protein n=1 Tax=Paenalkalicoccus suaedae TaxID=2592382 RepID=A0A859FCU7_9BACI|nr:DUF3939 domain-containing protein [Paenalkalicoccus suaedae]QKS70621.1 DUF3939 domain-containing protein [Paenalkalicoccus suaedae]
MVFRKRRKERSVKEVRIVSCTLTDVKKAVDAFARDAAPGISLRTLVNKDNELQTELLERYLGGIPNRPFYMSKETFDLFEEPDYAYHIDRCQIACDQYFLETGEFPTTAGDRTGKISYFKLRNYLPHKPPFDLYLDPRDRMVTLSNPVEM